MFGELAVHPKGHFTEIHNHTEDALKVDGFVTTHLIRVIAEHQPDLDDFIKLKAEFDPFITACIQLHQYFTSELQVAVINDFEGRRLHKNHGKAPQYIEGIIDSLQYIVTPDYYIHSLLLLYWDNSFESFHLIKESLPVFPTDTKISDRALKSRARLHNRLAEIHRAVQTERRLLSCDQMVLSTLRKHRAEYVSFLNQAQLAEVDIWIEKLDSRTANTREKGIYAFRAEQSDFDNVARFYHAIECLRSNADNLKKLLRIDRVNPIQFDSTLLSTVFDRGLPLSKRIRPLIGGYRSYDFLPYECIQPEIYEVDIGSPYIIRVPVAGYWIGGNFIPLESYDQSKTRVVHGNRRSPLFQKDGQMLIDPVLDCPVLLPFDNKLEVLHMGEWHQPATISFSNTGIHT